MMIEIEREEDGRWIAEIPALSGVMTYGQTREAAVRQVEALALRVLADRVESLSEKPFGLRHALLPLSLSRNR